MAQTLPREETIFHAALEIDAADQRSAYLDAACAGHEDVRQRVEALLRRHASAEGPLDRPAIRLATSAADTASEGPGTVIGPYKLLEQIGEGGMGLVFMADQMQPVRRRVALKVLKPGMDTRQVVARFEAERQALALMDHPNIARIHDGGTTATGRPYFVMELVRGVPITEFCDQRRLTTRQRLELFVSVCQAVQHAHQKGIIHRDLKPSNVLVTLHDTVAVPKVIDFGIAKATTQPLTDQTLFTNFTQVIGTPLYMSPEQAEMNALDVDTRSDVYALGVLLYELLTGTTPFTNEVLRRAGLDEMRRMIREEEPPTPSQRLHTLDAQESTTVAARRGVDGRRLGQALRGELDWIVMKALEKDRNRRYESASAFAADVQRYLNDDAVSACPPSAGYRLRKFVRRYRRALVTMALVATALIGATVVSTWQAIKAHEAQRQAQEAQRQAQANARVARRAVDRMYLQVAEKWLIRQPQMDEVTKEFLEEVLRFYQQASLEDAQDRDTRFEVALAQQRAGSILNYRFSQKDQAREALLRARDALRKLLDERPDDPEYTFELARTYKILAHTQHRDSAGNNLEEEDLRQSVRLLERLVERFPAEPKYRAELAKSLNNLCNPLTYRGRWPEMRKLALQALDLIDPLIRESPRPAYWRTRAHAHANLAEALVHEGELIEALAAQRQAIADFERLAPDASGEPEYQHDLSAWDWHMLGRCYRDLGEQLKRAGQLPEAEKAAERAVRIYLRVAGDFPTMPDFRESLADCHRRLGDIYNRRGKRDESKAEFLAASRLEQPHP
jgi:serine/threonine protein kinase